jgi:DNA polymerase III delta subunit
MGQEAARREGKFSSSNRRDHPMPKLSAAQFEAEGFDPQGQWCLLYGPEYELKLRLREGIINRLIPAAEREYAVETIAAAKNTKVGAILNAAQTASTFTAARVLVVDAIESVANAEQRELAKKLSAAPGTTVILVEGTSSARVSDDRFRGDRKGRLSTELIKTVAEAGSAVECRSLGRQEAVPWIVGYARSLGTLIKPAVAALLVERVGLDLGRLAREVEKLSLLAEGGAGITKQHIDEVTARTPEDNIFAVGDAMGAGDVDQALSILRDLLQYQGVEPTTALAFIARQFRLIWQAKVLLDAGWRSGQEAPARAREMLPEDADILRYLDGRRWLADRLAGQARRFTWPQLHHAIRRVLDAELAIKGIREGISDSQLALEMLVVDLTRRK